MSTMYMARSKNPDPDPDVDVIEVLDHGWDFIDQAIDLWRLVDEDRADAIAAIRDRVDQSEGERWIELADVAELARLLEGLEEALIGPVIDTRWFVSLDRLEELSRRVPSLDVRPTRTPHELEQTVSEVMANAIGVRIFLQDARRGGYPIILG